MNKQEIFNKAVRGLAKQGFARSMRKFPDFGDAGAYRGRRGMRCALGVLLRDSELPKELDVPSLDGEIWDGSGRKLPARLGGHGDFIRGLQSCHDRALDADWVKVNLRVFARREGLSIEGLPL